MLGEWSWQSRKTKLHAHHRSAQLVDWLAAKRLNTCVANRYCAREYVPGPCTSANVCKTTRQLCLGAEFKPVLRPQLADVALRDDLAEQAGTPKSPRHERVVANIGEHVRQFERAPREEPRA